MQANVEFKSLQRPRGPRKSLPHYFAPVFAALLSGCGLTSTRSEELPDIPSVEIAGIKIVRGLTKEIIRSSLPESHALWCAENAQDIHDGSESCAILLNGAEVDSNAGEILFQDGRVISANRMVGKYEQAYEGFFAFYELLNDLTNGEYHCGVVRTGSGPYQFFVALPEKAISVMLFSGRNGQGFVVLREGLRQHPTPDLEPADCWPLLAPDSIDRSR